MECIRATTMKTIVKTFECQKAVKMAILISLRRLSVCFIWAAAAFIEHIIIHASGKIEVRVYKYVYILTLRSLYVRIV